MNAPASSLCDTCQMFLATDEFHGCCSNACLDQLMGYMADVEEFYKSDHAAHWTEVQ